MSSIFNVVARYRTKPGSTEKVVELLGRMAAESRNEPGNISYEFFRGIEDDRQIVILESYHSAEAFEQHRQTPHFQTIGAQHIIPELESRTIITYAGNDSAA